jgi:lipopolysaccharide/colanic/teichoic acid biosynthesis glycosyltransferase
VRLKRLIDVIGASVGLLVTWPVLLLAWVGVRRSLGPPAIFRQTRTGQEGELFKMVKLRTMSNEVDAHGELLPDDERMTPLGSFLRSTSIDELPELFNVLKGDMSLVGPRPLLPEYLPRYNARQARRHDVPAGLTGLAQISGRTELCWNERFELDVQYVDNRSLRVDLKIMAKTVRKVLSRSDTGHDGEITGPEFFGDGSVNGEEPIPASGQR